tara:strand:+ start:149 stop:400 length:252 start_codon:yes stop_codon:yes gene_type:complete
MSDYRYYSVETFHLKYDRMSSRTDFHTLEEAMEWYNDCIRIDSDRGDGVDIRVMEVTLHGDSWEETCVAHMKDEGKYFWSESE